MILVFGGGGQLGQELVARARLADMPLTALGHAEADIADRAAVARAVATARPSIIVNAAAYNAVDKAEHDRATAMRANVEGPMVLAAAAAASGVPFVHVSTDYVFDGAKGAPYVETDRKAPLSVYGLSKAHGEDAVRATVREHYILRTAWVFGACAGNTLKTVLRLAAEQDELAFVSDQTGSPTWSADLADAVLLLARTDPARRPPGIYHVAGADAVTRHALASAIVAVQASYTGRQPPVKPVPAAERPTPAQRPAYSVLDITKFATTFGFRPHGWREAVSAAVAEVFAGGGA